MEYKSKCPNCGEPQTRWETLEPFPNFINQCVSCGEDYKSSKASCFIAIIIGVLIVTLFILADKAFIPWIIAIGINIAIFVIFIYLSPYLFTLKATPNNHKNILKKWILPLFKWQFLIITSVILLLLSNIYMLNFNKNNESFYKSIAEKVNTLETVDSLRKIATYENESLYLQNSLFNSFLDLSLTILVLILFALAFNLLFYFKIKKHITSRPT